MSCDRHWKLLLGDFRSLVWGLYVSKVKSKPYTRPIHPFMPVLLWKHSLICTPRPQHKHTHSHCALPPVKWTIPSKSKSSSMRPVSCSVEKYGNKSSPIPRAPWLISQPLRGTRWTNCLCLQATSCLIVRFIREEQELGERQVGAFTCSWRDEASWGTRGDEWKSEWFHAVPTWSHFFFFYLWCSTVTHQHTEALSELPENREGSTLFPTSRWKIPQTSARLIKTGLYLTDKQFIIFPVRICNAMATLFSATELVKFLILDSELTENG